MRVDDNIKFLNYLGITNIWSFVSFVEIVFTYDVSISEKLNYFLIGFVLLIIYTRVFQRGAYTPPEVNLNALGDNRILRIA